MMSKNCLKEENRLVVKKIEQSPGIKEITVFLKKSENMDEEDCYNEIFKIEIEKDCLKKIIDLNGSFSISFRYEG